MPELRAIARHFAERGGRFWVAEQDGRIVASAGYLPSPVGVELCKLYVDRSQRRRGLGRALVEMVEAAAISSGAAEVDLWSDTRFLDAHRLYERCGYVREAETRALADISNTVEYHFAKRLIAS